MMARSRNKDTAPAFELSAAERDRWFSVDGPELLERLGVRAGDYAIDFGAGIGSYALPLAYVVGARGKVMALEKNALCCEQIRAFSRQIACGGRIDVVDGDGMAFLDRAPSEVADVFLAFDVLQFVKDFARLFSAVARVLRPGGKLLVNPCVIEHPGRVDLELMFRALFAHGFRPVLRTKVRMLHYTHMADADDVFAYENSLDHVSGFQAAVFAATSQVPRGKVTTYGRIAAHLGGCSAQAVGQALRKNPFAPDVPCHRVITSDLRIGGFAGARSGSPVSRKLALLADEGVEFRGGRLSDPERLWQFSAQT